MNVRKKPLGAKNIVGVRVTQVRTAAGLTQNDLMARLDLEGVRTSLPALSLLEGQKRPVSDIERLALCRIFKKSADWFLGNQ